MARECTMRRMKWLMTVVLVIGAACAAEKTPAPSEKSGKPGPAPVAATQPDAAAAHGSSRWIEDDYARALAEARKKKVPLVIDMWATWCHTCLSMQNYVLTEANLAKHWDRFVWL